MKESGVVSARESMSRGAMLFMHHMIISTLFLVAALPLDAGVNRWTTNGPSGARINEVLVPSADPGVVYALSRNGTLFRSATAGEPSWTIVLEAPGPARLLASNPVNPDLLYLAYATGSREPMRLLRSSDKGATWTESRPPIIEPGDLAFATEQIGFIAAAEALWVTRDGGASWTKLRTGYHWRVIARNEAIYIVGKSNNTSSALDVLSVSRDLGTTWTELAQQTWAFDVNEEGNTLYRSTLPLSVQRSRDGGATWQTLPALPGTGTTVSAIAAVGEQVFITTELGVFVLDETVNQWVSIPELSNPRDAVSFARAQNGRLYAGRFEGVYVSAAGAPWHLAAEGMNQAIARSIATAGERDIFAATDRALFASDDAGQTWREVDGFVRPTSVTTGGDAIFVSSSEGIQKSVDGGASWTLVSDKTAASLLASPDSATNLYALYWSGLERSRDGGRTWASFETPLYFDWATIDTADPDRLYLATSSSWWGGKPGLARTEDGAETWTSVRIGQVVETVLSAGTAGPSVVQVAVACTDESITFGCGITTSRDGGTTWSAPRLSEEQVDALAIDPARPWRSYAGTASGRVYRSDDYGDEWILFSEGLDGYSVSELRVAESGAMVVAATAGGVYVYEYGAVLDFERLPDDAGRLSRLMDQLMSQDATTASVRGLLIPAAGTVRGAGGLTFRTDVTLGNARATAQEVAIVWLPQGNSAGANVPAFVATLSAMTGDDDGAVTLSDLTDMLGLEGLGSLLVFGIDAEGNIDEDADLDGFARIRSRAECGGWVSQSFPAIPSNALGTERRSRILGLRHEPSSRTNVGIVNLSNAARTFTVVAKGETAREQFAVTVPFFSTVLTVVPNRNYGAMTVTVEADDRSTPWVAFGSSVDNVSGDAWSVIGRRPHTP